MNQEHIKHLEKLDQSIDSPWKRLGVTPEFYIKDLTVRWNSINALLKSGKGDRSLVKSTITDTIEFIIWAQTKRELTSAVALVKSYMMKAREHYADQSRTTGINERT